MHKNELEDAWQSAMLATPYQFALKAKQLHETNPWPNQVPLEQLMNTLMTELWDIGFSQTEIRTAFANAMADLPRYAAGEEVRG